MIIDYGAREITTGWLCGHSECIMSWALDRTLIAGPPNASNITGNMMMLCDPEHQYQLRLHIQQSLMYLDISLFLMYS